MNNSTLSNIKRTYPFLDEASIKEPFLIEVLNEIVSCQKKYEKKQSNYFATKEHIYASRNIKMPFSPARDKNLHFILDHLEHRFPEFISTLIRFELSFNQAEKRLVVKEHIEYCYSLAHEEIDKLQARRDQESAASIEELISKFRIFNLTKLMAMVENKKSFNTVLGKLINKRVFNYKMVEIRGNKFLPVQELCFHIKNYSAVKESLSIGGFKSILGHYREMLVPRLKNYGIANANITDYTENKIDYILHILLDDLKTSLTPKDTINIQNFKSLRECILKVDKAVDPTEIHDKAIIQYIHSNRLAQASDVLIHIGADDESVIKSWAKEDTLKKNHIIKYEDGRFDTYFISGPKLLTLFEEYYQNIRYDREFFDKLSSNEKEVLENKLLIIRECSLRWIGKAEAPHALKISKEDLETLSNLIEEYDSWKKEKELRNELSSEDTRSKGVNPLVSLIQIILSIFTIFGGSKGYNEKQGKGSSGSGDGYSEQSSSSSHGKRGSSSSAAPSPKKMHASTKQIITKIAGKNAPLIALSDYIELNKENDPVVDQVIQEMRENNVKIIMPVYNARKALYPKRSSKLLIPDIEYLLISPDTLKTPDSITHYVDSLVGYKMKEDIIPGNTLVNIEKYLRNIQRQQRAKLRIQRETHKKTHPSK
jgi:predicted CopG family antitoxin